MGVITGDPTKIKLGPHTVQFGTSGSEVNLGFTQGGSELIYTPTYREIMVDQLGSPVDIRIVQEQFEMKFNLAEISRANFLIAFPAASAASGAASAVGVNFGRRPGYSIAQNASGVMIIHPVGLAAADKSRDWTIPIAVNTSSINLPWKADTETPIPCNFKAIANAAREDGQHLFRYGY
ncbi:MAG: hypothetical protein KAJ19_08375, partial [Gammaproteobacteria bacterium]|nr:hypothetical protein [Gammaproteobacteria bacterium]